MERGHTLKMCLKLKQTEISFFLDSNICSTFFHDITNKELLCKNFVKIKPYVPWGDTSN